MQQTTYGEIPKKKKTTVYGRKFVESFLESNSEDFEVIESSTNCLYSKDSSYLMPDVVSNYLNMLTKGGVSEQLKDILRHEYLKLESAYPKLGFLFLEKYFKHNLDIKHDSYYLHRASLCRIFKNLKCEKAKQVLESLINHSSLEFNIEVKASQSDEVLIKKNENINFRISYDSSYLGKKSKHSVKNFKYIIIDGRIDSIGEIYHLLYKAAEEKIPYIIFCFGVMPEVKDVILQNNAKGITEIMPVCIEFNEYTINILRDLQVVLGGDVVSSEKGQTISQEVRKDLKYGKQIEFDRAGFIITPTVDRRLIEKHRKNLEKKIKKINRATDDANRVLLVERKKRMSNKSLELFVPISLLKNLDFRSDLDYSLRMLANSNNVMSTVTSKITRKEYFIPRHYLNMLDKSLESLNKIYSDLDKIVLWKCEV